MQKVEIHPLVIETAAAATFIEMAARSAGDERLARHAGDAALHLRGVEGPYNTKNRVCVLEGDEQLAIEGLLRTMAGSDDLMAPAAEAVLVELTNPAQFWQEIHTAQELAKAHRAPNNASGLTCGSYATGPVSAVDLLPVRPVAA